MPAAPEGSEARRNAAATETDTASEAMNYAAEQSSGGTPASELGESQTDSERYHRTGDRQL